MGEVIELPDGINPCAECGIPLTSATADGREDGLYCDKCLEAIVDRHARKKARGDGVIIPRINPYPEHSPLAHSAWDAVNKIFVGLGRACALRKAQRFDAELDLNLEAQVMRWNL